MPQLWERQPGETTAAYRAFEAVLQQWPDCNFVEAYRQISGRTKVRKMSGTWTNWKDNNRWKERIEAYTQWKLEESARARRQADQEEYSRKLEEYREVHENLAKGSYNIMMAGVKTLENYLVQYTGNAKKGIEPTRKIKNLTEASQVSRIINDFMKQAPAVWESALGIPELRQLLEQQDKG